jgi:hypothetical protein
MTPEFEIKPDLELIRDVVVEFGNFGTAEGILMKGLIPNLRKFRAAQSAPRQRCPGFPERTTSALRTSNDGWR